MTLFVCRKEDEISELALLLQSSGNLIQIQDAEVAKLVDSYCDDPSPLKIDPFECSIDVCLSSGIIVHILLGKNYPQTRPLVSIDGLHDRQKHETINKHVGNFLAGFPPGEPLLDALIDFIQGIIPPDHSNDTTNSAKPQSAASVTGEVPPTSCRRILFWAHHLLATSKRKQLRDQASTQDINIIARVGYPGYIAAEGRPQDIQLFVQEVKTWRWAAIQLKFDTIEALTVDSEDSSWRQLATLKTRFTETESLSEFAFAIAQIPDWKSSMLH